MHVFVPEAQRKLAGDEITGDAIPRSVQPWRGDGPDLSVAPPGLAIITDGVPGDFIAG